MNGSAASVVKRRQVEEPSVRVPSPGGNRAVDDRGPAEGKDQTGQDAATFEGASDQDLDGTGAEQQLVEAEDDLWDVGVAGRGCRRDVLQAEVGHVADERRSSP